MARSTTPLWRSRTRPREGVRTPEAALVVFLLVVLFPGAPGGEGQGRGRDPQHAQLQEARAADLLVRVRHRAPLPGPSGPSSPSKEFSHSGATGAVRPRN